MSHHGLVVVTALAAVLAWSPAALAGWVVEQAAKGPDGGGRQELLVEANRIKTVMFGPDGRPRVAFIVDLDADTITQVDHQGRHYVTATIEEFIQAVTGAARAVTGQMAEARKAMEQALQNLPPEQRKAMEQMMRARMPSGAGECVEPRREVRKTGPSATIAGFPAARWEILADGQVESEVWLAPGLAVGRELDVRKLERFTTAMAAAAPGCGAQRPAPPGADPTWRLVGEGFPVRMVMPRSGITVEVVRAESRAVPAAEFQPPAGFARRTVAEMMRGQ